MTIITDSKAIRLAHLFALKGALSLEVKGMQRSRGRSAYSTIKQEFNLKGTKAKVLEQFKELIKQLEKQLELPLEETQNDETVNSDVHVA
jgi:hypothetical protein